MNTRIVEYVLAERTRTQWENYPDFHPVIEPFLHHNLDSGQRFDKHCSSQQLLQLLQLALDSDEEQSYRTFSALQSHCTIADPSILAQFLSSAIVQSCNEYPHPPAEHAGPNGWLESALEFKAELLKKGDMIKQLWRIAKARNEDIENQALQLIIAALVQKQEANKLIGSPAASLNPTFNKARSHSLYYLLHCGPLIDHQLPLWDEESIVNALVRLRDGHGPDSYENQLLILVNLLERFFSWIENVDSPESIEELKVRVASYSRIPELLVYTLDTIIRYLDGRWLKIQVGEGAKSTNNLTMSLMDINREREAVQYVSANPPGTQKFSESKHTTRGKSLRERPIPVKVGRDPVEREFQISDLVSRCLQGHGPEVIEQVMHRFVLHIVMRVDTAMVSVSTQAAKLAAQQRDKILLAMMSENPVYRRIMISAMGIDRRSAHICLSLIKPMLCCSIAHWNTCKNVSPTSYPKELADAVWLAQLAEQTGLIPDPVNQASVLFPLIESRDIGQILEQCYHDVLVRNAEVLVLPGTGAVTGVASTEAAADTATETLTAPEATTPSASTAASLPPPPTTATVETGAAPLGPSTSTTATAELASEGSTDSGLAVPRLSGSELVLIRRVIVKHAGRAFHLMSLFTESAAA
ncbi:hypothetical protein BGZ94_003419 [Podila epigama]|nr:hypothetical protein BGZ94_003419 [Podila epigama]